MNALYIVALTTGILTVIFLTLILVTTFSEKWNDYKSQKRYKAAEATCERTETEPLPFADNEVEALRDALADAEAENAVLRRMVGKYHKVKGKGKKD